MTYYLRESLNVLIAGYRVRRRSMIGPTFRPGLLASASAILACFRIGQPRSIGLRDFILEKETKDNSWFRRPLRPIWNPTLSFLCDFLCSWCGFLFHGRRLKRVEVVTPPNSRQLDCYQTTTNHGSLTRCSVCRVSFSRTVHRDGRAPNVRVTNQGDGTKDARIDASPPHIPSTTWTTRWNFLDVICYSSL